MNYTDFLKLRDQKKIPNDLPLLLKALLLDADGDWDGAHRIAQDEWEKIAFALIG